MQDRIHKSIVRIVVQNEKLGDLNRLGRHLLGPGNHEFRYRGPVQGRSAREQSTSTPA